MINKKRFIFIQTVLVIAMLLSLFLVYEHFSPNASKYCSFGASLDCGIVNKSPYANIDGIFYLLVIDLGLNMPLIDISGTSKFIELLTTQAFLGFLTLLLVSYLVYALYKKKSALGIENSRIIYFLRGIMTFSVIYGFYLFLIQHFILKTYCIFCLSLDITLLILLVTFYKTK